MVESNSGASKPKNPLAYYGTPQWTHLVESARDAYDKAFMEGLYTPGSSRVRFPSVLYVASLPAAEQKAAVVSELNAEREAKIQAEAAEIGGTAVEVAELDGREMPPIDIIRGIETARVNL